MKHHTFLIALVATGVAALCLLRVQGPTACAGDEPKKPVTIPREEIYTTCDETSPKYLNYGDGEIGFAMLTVFKGSLTSGASNAYLVRGDDILAAINAAFQITARHASAAQAVHPDENRKSDIVWFAAYLGTGGSSTPRWASESITLEDKRIRLTYKLNENAGKSKDIHPYIVFARLGKLPPATYTLELCDSDLKDVMLMRKVMVR